MTSSSRALDNKTYGFCHRRCYIKGMLVGRFNEGFSMFQAMEGNVLTISRGTWMELANLSFRDWEESVCDRQLGGRQKRASVKNVARYYHDYVDIKGLRPYFQNSAEVTSVRRLDEVKGASDENCDRELWQVSGHVRTAEGLEDFQYVTPNVVLAIGGYDLPNRMNVPGESLPFVVKSLQKMEQLITSRQLTSKSEPILIVGAGLSAADAIIAAHFHGIPIIHAFRRKAEDPSLIFRSLPSNMYPEYHKVLFDLFIAIKEILTLFYFVTLGLSNDERQREDLLWLHFVGRTPSNTHSVRWEGLSSRTGFINANQSFIRHRVNWFAT